MKIHNAVQNMLLPDLSSCQSPFFLPFFLQKTCCSLISQAATLCSNNQSQRIFEKYLENKNKYLTQCSTKHVVAWSLKLPLTFLVFYSLFLLFWSLKLPLSAVMFKKNLKWEKDPTQCSVKHIVAWSLKLPISFSPQRCSVITHFSDELLACDFSAQICSFMILAGYSNKGGFTCTSTLLLTLSNHSIRPFVGFNSFHFDLSREPECRVALKGQVVKKYEIPLC